MRYLDAVIFIELVSCALTAKTAAYSHTIIEVADSGVNR